jgi:hypothetical protein
MTTTPLTSSPRSRLESPRKVQQAARRQARRLTEEIMTQGAQRSQEATAALALTQATLTDAELLAWRDDLQQRVATILHRPEQHLGFIEETLARAAQEPLRLLAQSAAQLKANTTPRQCPHCQRELTRQKLLPRTLHSRFGPLRFWRHYGWCSECETWYFPADYALGLAKKAPASPYLQEMSALLTTKMPPDQAVALAQRFGVDLSRCTLHREAHRQGLKAQEARADALAQLDSWDDFTALARATEGPPAQPFTLVIEIDAWNIRERDHWGQTDTLRAQGEKLDRWHWVYMATVFRLDHRGHTAGERPVISQRGYVATRGGLEALTRQLHYEAIQRGLGQAQEVLVIADGALWIWNLVADRFPQARQRLDLWHADQHLWEVAHDLYGRDTPEARQWIAPLLEALRNDQSPQIIHTLQELQPRLHQALQDKVRTQIEYWKNNQNRLQYRAIMAARKAVKAGTATPEQTRRANEPLGSGAIEATCRQYQCRFKRTGQFWTTAGDEALMCLETFWRNDRWHLLFPHAEPPSLANN